VLCRVADVEDALTYLPSCVLLVSSIRQLCVNGCGDAGKLLVKTIMICVPR